MPITTLTKHQFVSGGFNARFGSSTGKVGKEIDLGTTERGITIGWDLQRQDITVDSTGNVIVASLNLGVPFIRVTIESMAWQTGPSASTDRLLDYLGFIFGKKTYGGISTSLGQVGIKHIGADLISEFADELELTAVTGLMSVPSTKQKFLFHRAVPLESPSVLLTARNNIRIPFSFIVFAKALNTTGGEASDGDAINIYNFMTVTYANI